MHLSKVFCGKDASVLKDSMCLCILLSDIVSAIESGTPIEFPV